MIVFVIKHEYLCGSINDEDTKINVIGVCDEDHLSDTKCKAKEKYPNDFIYADRYEVNGELD